MHTGTVIWFDSNKGYGFIADDMGGDVFVHQSHIMMDGFRCLTAGQKVQFDIEPSEKGVKAVRVTVQ